MLAYVFWHRPYSWIDQKAYEQSLVRFQAELMREPPPGLIGASTFAISAVPWLSGRRLAHQLGLEANERLLVGFLVDPRIRPVPEDIGEHR